MRPTHSAPDRSLTGEERYAIAFCAVVSLGLLGMALSLVATVLVHASSAIFAVGLGTLALFVASAAAGILRRRPWGMRRAYTVGAFGLTVGLISLGLGALVSVMSGTWLGIAYVAGGTALSLASYLAMSFASARPDEEWRAAGHDPVESP
jgi:FtsH-binding integral membrane protein